MTIDNTDKEFVIIIKKSKFYRKIYGAVRLARQYRDNGKDYSTTLISPYWFNPDDMISHYYDGRTLILLWYNKNFKKCN